MGTLLGTTLVLISLAVLVYPFISRRGYTLAGDPTIERLRVARMRVYRQIADLEGDYQTGDLTETDHDLQLGELRVAAARIMQREEQLQGATGRPHRWATVCLSVVRWSQQTLAFSSVAVV